MNLNFVDIFKKLHICRLNKIENNGTVKLRLPSISLSMVLDLFYAAILSDQDNGNAVRESIRKLEALFSHSKQAVERSLLAMIANCCGLETYTPKIH